MKFSCTAVALVISTASAWTTTTTAPRPNKSTRFDTALSVKRNPNFSKLVGGYLFPEIARRRNAYMAENPDKADSIISLGIGDTTQPIPKHILSGLVEGAKKLGTNEGYSGYGPERGRPALCEKIASTLYNGMVDADEVFVSGTFNTAVWQKCVETTPVLSPSPTCFSFHRRRQVRHYAFATNVWSQHSLGCSRS
jgi:hypothetical protein